MIKIPKIVQTIELAEYAPELEGQAIHVWVNPPRAVRVEGGEIFQSLQILTATMRDLAERANAVNGNKEEYAGQVDAVSGKLSAANERLFDWYARIWSQGPEGEITPDQVHTFIQEALDTDPVLWGFLRDRTIEMIDEHARGVKKKLMTS